MLVAQSNKEFLFSMAYILVVNWIELNSSSFKYKYYSNYQTYLLILIEISDSHVLSRGELKAPFIRELT